MSGRLRWACRVCLALGIADPESWLDSVSPRTLALWQAFYRIEPWGRDYERDAILSMMVSQVSSFIAAGNGAKVKPIPMADFMPAEWIQPTQQTDESSIKSAEMSIAARFGKR